MAAGVIGVAVTEGETGRMLILRAASMAHRMGGRWVAFLISPQPWWSGSETLERSRWIVEAIDLIASLGGTAFCCASDDVATTLVELAESQQVQMLLVGPSSSAPVLRWIVTGVNGRIIEADRSFDVVVAARGIR